MLRKAGSPHLHRHTVQSHVLEMAVKKPQTQPQENTSGYYKISVCDFRELSDKKAHWYTWSNQTFFQ